MATSRADVEVLLIQLLDVMKLTHWNIKIRWDLKPEKDDDGKRCLASIKVHPDYDQASIRMNEDFAKWSDRELRATLIHELLHVYERDVRATVADACATMKKNPHSLVWSRYEHEAEAMIDRLCFVILDALDA